MSNPFDEIDPVTEARPRQITPKATNAPAVLPAEPTVSQGNPFEAPEVLAPETEAPKPKMSNAQLGAEIFKRAKAGGTTKDILAWMEENGHGGIANKSSLGQYVRLIKAGKWNKPIDVRTGDVAEAPAVVKPPAIDRGSSIDTFFSQARNGLMLDWGDEAEALAKSGGVIGLPGDGQDGLISSWLTGKTDDFWKRYETNYMAEDAKSRGDFQFSPGAAWTGYGLGTVATAVAPMGPAVSLGRAGRLATGAAVGATESVISTAGQNDPGNRAENLGTAALVGAGVGAVAEPVVKLGGRTIAAVANRTGLTDQLDKFSGKINSAARSLGINRDVWNRVPAEIKALATRTNPTPEDITRMRDATQAWREAGVDPRLIDVQTRAERDVVGSAARKDTGAGRDAAYVEAERVGANLGNRATGQFQRVTNITGNSREAAEAIGERRDYRATEAMNAMRGEPIEITNEFIDVLGTRTGQTALRMLTRNMSAAEADQVRRIPELMRQLSALGPSARAQILRQQGGGGFTIGMVDRLRKSLNDMASAADRAGRGAEAREIRGLRDTVRSSATRADPRYAEYLRDYGEDSRSLQAVELGANAFKANTDEFAPAARALSDDMNAVLRQKDMAPATGRYKILDSYDNRNAQGEGSVVIERLMDDGSRVQFQISIPPRNGTSPKARDGVASVNVTSTGADGRHHSYGDARAFNNFGPEVIADAARYMREIAPWVRGVTGSRVGGVREATRNRAYAARRAERERAELDAGVQRAYDDPASFNDPSDAAGVAPPPRRERRPMTGSTAEYDANREQLRSALFDPPVVPSGEPIARAADGELGAGGAGALANRVWEEYLDHDAGANTIADYLAQNYGDSATRLPPEVVRMLRRHEDEVGNGSRHFASLPDESPSVDDNVDLGEWVPDNTGFDPTGNTPNPPIPRGPSVALEPDFDADFNPQSTGDAVWDNLISHGDPSMPQSRTTPAEMRDIIDEQELGPVDDNFINAAVARFNERADLHNTELEMRRGNGNQPEIIEPDFNSGPGIPADAERTSNGLSFDELNDQYQEFVQEHREWMQSQGLTDYDMPDMAVWMESNFFPSEAPPSFWERARRMAENFGRDESGAKRMPAAMDRFQSPGQETATQQRINRATGVAAEEGPRLRRPVPGEAPITTTTVQVPPAPERLASARTDSPSPVGNNGVESRRRNVRPDSIGPASEYSWHPTTPGENNAPSDRQLAVGEMGRQMQRQMGESPRGPGEMINRMALSPEQQARNEALMGVETAAALQRGMDAERRYAQNTAQINPGTGSQTAIRSIDDNALDALMAMGGNAMAGSKVGFVQNLMGLLRNAGMTDTQTTALVQRAIDPAQTEIVINQLEQVMGRDRAMTVVALLQQAGYRATGAALGTDNPNFPEE